MLDARRKQSIVKILPVAPFAHSQRQIAKAAGVVQSTVSKVMNSEEYQAMYSEQKKGIVQDAIQFARLWFDEQLKTSKSKNSLEAATVWAIMIDKITKLSGDDVQWKNNIQAGGNITLKVNSDVKEIMEKIKK